ncbi:carotenoid oxygenase [Nitrosopumilus sp. b1]|uniref:HAD-IA family hydrolase n=1 Tax=Nitrosopumilus sp. b1 TaxID=2109907 RepID=UPI0015F70038|nr:HAD-IA family hydrolase [Nitrosopumilus sp. b1]KAF6243490.1 carotenoid oxygenase [Nitrosopumilus sp. b1]
MSNPTVIFDFDGTIADTLDAIIKILNKLSDEFHFKKIKDDEIEYLRGKRPRKILQHLGISLIKLPFVVRKTRKEINNQIAYLKPPLELREPLLELKKRGCKIGILTTNVESNVQKFLQGNNLDIFDFFYSGPSVFGKHKIIKKILHDKKLNPNQVFFVGDEVRDITAGKKSKLHTIGVAWGYNTKEALIKENPEHVIDSPTELLKIVFPREKEV